LWLAFAFSKVAAVSPIPPEQSLNSPTPERLAAICESARIEGWAPQAAPLWTAATTACEKEKLTAAAAWLQVYRWAVLFGTTEGQFIPQWIRAVQNAQVAHPNMSTRYRARPTTLGVAMSPECQAWLIGDSDFSEQFFTLVQPVDYLPDVFKLLGELHRRDPARFATYANLALAIAVVYDTPPPPDWPHLQVPADALPRRWPDAVQAFDWWTREDEAGHTYHRLAQLGADELKFVIDASAPFDQLAWSQEVANYPLNQLAKAYTMVTYRRDRAANQRPIWTEKIYSLPAILGAGGICVDQAYFAAQVGKARGVPTLLFQGAGRDGRHAWFGFLDAQQKWQLDAGRYAEQRFVTGLARDPQTWRIISDHELKFLSERFRATESFKRSRTQTAFAAEYLARRDVDAALRAARKAVNYERRNNTAWDTLLQAEAAANQDAKQMEAVLYEAIQAFQRYPDLEAAYSKRLVASLRARGQASAADAEQRRLERKYQGDRGDLSLQQARDQLLRSIATQSIERQMSAFEATLKRFGRGAGIAFYDQIVVGFVGHLLELGHTREAVRAASRARDVLKVEPGSQLDQEFSALLARLRAMH
jgi:hypothetical protein